MKTTIHYQNKTYDCLITSENMDSIHQQISTYQKDIYTKDISHCATDIYPELLKLRYPNMIDYVIEESKDQNDSTVSATIHMKEEPTLSYVLATSHVFENLLSYLQEQEIIELSPYLSEMESAQNRIHSYRRVTYDTHIPMDEKKRIIKELLTSFNFEILDGIAINQNKEKKQIGIRNFQVLYQLCNLTDLEFSFDGNTFHINPKKEKVKKIK